MYWLQKHHKVLKMYLLLHIYLAPQCGSKSALRVYGGRDAVRSEFPYVIRIEVHTTVISNGNTKSDFHQRCTGAALTHSWILSAAHCHAGFDYNDKNNKLVARYNSYFPQYLGKTKNIIETKFHPTYNGQPFHDLKGVLVNNDICLFRSEGIVVSSYGKLSPVDYRSLIGHEAYALGFGLTNASAHQKPLQVLKGMLYVCYKAVASGIKSQLLCLAPQCGVKTTVCSGDSGGPVVHSSGIVGVISQAQGNCDEQSTSLDISFGTPAGKFAIVSPNFDWISNIIANKYLG